MDSGLIVTQFRVCRLKDSLIYFGQGSDLVYMVRQLEPITIECWRI